VDRIVSFKVGQSSGSVAVSPDGKTLAWNDTNGKEAWMNFRDLTTGRDRKVKPKEARATGNSLLVFGPDGKTLAAGGVKGVYFWEDLSGAVEPRLLDSASIRSLRYAPDGHALAFGNQVNQESRLTVWAVSPGKGWSISRPGQMPSTVAFTPDGAILAVGSYQSSSITFWKTASGEEAGRKLNEPNGKNVQALAVAPDGKLAAAAKDAAVGHVTVWADHTSPKPLMKCKLPVGVLAMAFASDSRHLALLCSDGTVAILRLPGN
jgi:WD40 repeat protein